MATVAPGPYMVRVVFKDYRGNLRNEIVSYRVSKRIAFADAVELLQHGMSEGGKHYEVVSLTVRKVKGAY
jgi:hypothetical protein